MILTIAISTHENADKVTKLLKHLFPLPDFTTHLLSNLSVIGEKMHSERAEIMTMESEIATVGKHLTMRTMNSHRVSSIALSLFCPWVFSFPFHDRELGIYRAK